MFGFNELQEVLAQWPKVACAQNVAEDSVIERIRQILAATEGGETLAKMDLIPLLRHLLLRESADSGTVKRLRVPAASPWPNKKEWSSHGISSLSAGIDEAFLISATPWYPDWLGSDDRGVFADAFSSKIVREYGECAADPFLEDVTGYSNYSSPGQREAVRAAFLIPPGDTLIVNLPTGSGKSLVGQAPALVHRQEGHLTLFVVPTVALAIDQASKMQAYFQRLPTTTKLWPLAWYGGSSEAERSEMRQRLLNGTQRILFTSPEALTTSLLRTIFEVARNGMLRYLVIDEAHLVTQWGDEFRPAFQMLAGLRNTLLRQSETQPFRTLLMSATFTPETIETLADLFGPSNRVQMVSAVHLRPEPQYWNHLASSKLEKAACIVEALRYAPRPFILYVTTRKDALFWHTTLTTTVGYKRLKRFDGNTPDHERKSVVDAWTANQLDGVVATSAFGVGIDKQDVRTIIHAAIPETLDRFYQEVGRGGRDGKHSISLVVYDDSDWSLPERMATPSLISNELGYARWRALYDSKDNEDEHGCFHVNLEAVRVGLPGSNEENVRWNMRTLLLMSRAGFLSLEVEPSDRLQMEDEEGYSGSLLATMATIKIRLLRHDHLLPEAWEDAISKSRAKTIEAGTRNFKMLKKMLEQNREMSETLAELYRSNSEKWPILVTRVCGGCTADRFDETRDDGYNVPNAIPIHNPELADTTRWCSTFPYLNPKYVPVFYDPEHQHGDVIRLAKWLVSECGAKEISAREGSTLANSQDWRNLYKQSPSGVLIHRGHKDLEEEPYSPLSRITVFDSHINGDQILQALSLQRPLHLVLYPLETTDPNHPLRKMADTATNSVRLEQLIAVIHQ